MDKLGNVVNFYLKFCTFLRLNLEILQSSINFIISSMRMKHKCLPENYSIVHFFTSNKTRTDSVKPVKSVKLPRVTNIPPHIASFPPPQFPERFMGNVIWPIPTFPQISLPHSRICVSLFSSVRDKFFIPR